MHHSWWIGQGHHLVFPDGHEKLKFGRGRWYFACCQVSLNFVQHFRGEVENVWANQSPSGHLGFPVGLKNTNSVEDVEILLPVNIRWIPFSDLREDGSISANQRLMRPSYFSDRPEKKNTNLVEEVKFLLPVNDNCKGFFVKTISIPDEELFSKTAVGCTASYFV